MKYSKLFSKTKREFPSDEISKNAKLLIQGGYVYKEMAGVYSYLPLGLRVIENIKKIIRKEMNKIGGDELIMSSLQRKELWEKTDRWNDENVDVWFKSFLKNGSEIGFGWSHEEPITEMMKDYIKSYRDLPVFVYQFQTKLRNELRAKSGILRGREFVMKDMYSYTSSEEEHSKFYNAVINAYIEIFKEVGIGEDTFVTFASGGAFTQFSHEFQTLCEAGEDIIYVDRKKRIGINKEVMNDDILKQLNLKKENLEEIKTAEVGNIFSFGDTKSKQLELYFQNSNGETSPVILGSYGIGVTRLMGVIVEKFSDEKGIVWPESVSPYEIHLVGLNLEDNNIREFAFKTYDNLVSKGYSVLFDDRIEEISAGEKFATAELIGIPKNVIVSKRTLSNNIGEFEVRDRKTGDSKIEKLF